MKKHFYLLLLITGCIYGTRAQSWTAVGTGMPSEVNVLSTYNNNLYAGGDFNTAGGISASYIAQWNDTAWASVIPTDAQIFDFLEWGGELYAAGQFVYAGTVQANGVAKWNGVSWAPVGQGFNGDVNTLAVYNGELYAGGGFFMSGDTMVMSIARFDGNHWRPLGSGTDGQVYAMTVYNSELIIGGSFSAAGGVSGTQKIARWNGSSWNALSTGVSATVLALTTLGSDLYVGGNFTVAGGQPADKIAKWNGTTFAALGTGMPSLRVNDLLAYNGQIYAGGTFLIAGGITCNHVAKWNPTNSTWSALGNGLGGWVNSLTVYKNMLYAAGSFEDPSGVIVGAVNVARWNGLTSAINEPSAESICIYPNPSTGEFKLNLPTDATEILITDMLGKQIAQAAVSQPTVSMQIHAGGLYLVNVKTNGGTRVSKLIVNR